MEKMVTEAIQYSKHTIHLDEAAHEERPFALR